MSTYNKASREAVLLCVLHDVANTLCELSALIYHRVAGDGLLIFTVAIIMLYSSIHYFFTFLRLAFGAVMGVGLGIMPDWIAAYGLLPLGTIPLCTFAIALPFGFAFLMFLQGRIRSGKSYPT